MGRFAGPDLPELGREAVAVLAIAALLSLALFWFWFAAPREGASVGSRTAAIAALGVAELPKHMPQRVRYRLSLQLDDGTVWTLPATVAGVARCRVGDRVAVVGARTNSGVTRWRLAPGGCIAAEQA